MEQITRPSEWPRLAANSCARARARRHDPQSLLVMALEELPHDGRRVDFLPRPLVPEAVDANQPDLAAIRTSFVAQRRERTRRVVENRLALARVVARPAGERLRNALHPLAATIRQVTRVGVLRVGEAVKRQHRNR